MTEIPQFLTGLLAQALTERASDIHIEPCPNEHRIRFRIDGLLERVASISPLMGSQLIARIKVLSRLDVAERRRPQDGTFVYDHESRTSDIRVATFPTVHGEKVVLRLLDRATALLELNQLGIEEKMYVRLRQLVSLSSGFVLVTGTTGSGKTTTVHALLATLDTLSRNSVTLEDPVEYILEGTTQTQVHPEIGLTFEAGLRSLLRQDPDSILVGEIRDKETAHVAVQAALTGHLVFSTLHTTDTVGALMRLTHMGIERYLLAGSVKVIIAQQLIRRLCSNCSLRVSPTSEQELILKRQGYALEYLSMAQGCTLCRGTGYRGRIGVFQLLELSHSFCSLFIHGADYDALVAHARQEGMRSLADDAFDKLKKGIVSFSDYLQTATLL